MSSAAPQQRGSRFWIGLGVMVLSFALYPAYGLIAFLPISAQAKAGAMAAGWALSWSLFFVGSLLAGKEGGVYLKQLFSRRGPGTSEPPP